MTLDDQLEGLGRLLDEARDLAGDGDIRGLAHALRNLATNATLLASVVATRPLIVLKDSILNESRETKAR